MPVTNEDLESELGYVTNPSEQQHIRSLWDEADPLMQDNALHPEQPGNRYRQL